MATATADKEIAKGFAGHRFFFALAAVMAVACFVGFAPTYYLVGVLNGTTSRGVADAAALTPIVHAHALAASAWLALLLAQTGLVAANRRDTHRRLGVAALPVSAAVLATGLWLIIDGARRASTPPGWTPAQFLLVQFGTLVGFVVFAILGLVCRRRAEAHKRLMMLATMALAVPALARLWGLLGLREYARGAVGGMLLSDLFLLALVAYDYRARHRLHPVTLWGGGALLAAQPLRVILSGTDAWQSIGRALI